LALGDRMKMQASRKLGTFTAIGIALSAAIGLTLVSQGCTFVTNDDSLDGGGFTGNDGAVPPVDAQTYNSCNQCLFQSCQGQWALCTGDTECMAIYTCSTAPSCASDHTCVTNCYNAHPNGHSKYLSLAYCDNAGECGKCASNCPRP